ncbi:MAG TPA: hypothetical protein PKV98_10085 [Burkholderiaceae bacterium]|nr:hypothetical protein [Burkholderiaceae bacterium]
MTSAPNQEQLREAQELLSLSTDALYQDLGERIGERGLPEDLIRAGRARYRAVTEKCRSAICGNDTIRVLSTDKTADKATALVLAIADTILHTMGVPVPAMTVAAILVQSGLETFCKAQWS